MCEHCCSLEGVLKELVGPKVAEVLMKRVRSRMHDVSFSNESKRIGVELC
jgi:cytochrome c2